MNNSKRDKVNEALRYSRRLHQTVSLLKGFEEKTVTEYLDSSIYSCEQVCSMLNSILHEEVLSHSNVPRNLSRADNTSYMRIAMSNIRKALESYSTLLVSLSQYKDKCDLDNWSDRVDRSIEWECEVEDCELLLMDSI